MAVRPELVAYLKIELMKGVSEKRIRQFLTEKGYTKEMLDEGFALARGQPAPAAPAQPAPQPATAGQQPTPCEC